MPALSSDLRKVLETTVVKARDLAERGACDALTALAVPASQPFPTMGEDERKLRNRLRAHARQLGDQRDPQKGSQGIERLVREMAYEHWHRMLFARFLAENQLLIEPSSGVSVSLDECEELAAEAGTDLWGMAAQFAQAMLPQIFRVDDPVLAAKLPLEIRQQLQGLLTGLETEVFTGSDSLGWTYQFWQTKSNTDIRKQMKSGLKVGADELPPVTQRFTEDYMVDFLLDNTLGAWHAGKVLAANRELSTTAQNEEDVRSAVTLPGCQWAYLRFTRSKDGSWSPTAGTFEGWPKTAAELKCLDPCMGSGHFIVAMFERLVALRMDEESLTETAAVLSVIEANLFGLEIDPRCTQIAAFSLALAAWRGIGHQKLPAINLACSGMAPNTSESEWLALAGDNERLRNGMERLYQLFNESTALGSLVNPSANGASLLSASFSELQPLLAQAIAQESAHDNSYELAVTARGLAKAAGILASRFTLIATNVPYLGRGNQNEELKTFCEANHQHAKADLSTSFLERCVSFCTSAGSVALVAPNNWMFLGGYKRLRENLLTSCEWLITARLGSQAFEAIAGEVVNVNLIVLTKGIPTDSRTISWTDATSEAGAAAKSRIIRDSGFLSVRQKDQLENPDSRIVFDQIGGGDSLGMYVNCSQGTMPADRALFIRYFWELQAPSESSWKPLQSSSPSTNLYGGLSGAFNLSDFEKKYKELGGRYQGKKNWGSFGVSISQMSSLPVTLYLGDIYDGNVDVIVPKAPEDLPALWCYFSSGAFESEIRKIEHKLDINTGAISKVPFDLDRWRLVANDDYPNGLPRPYSSDPTQWLFSGHPSGSDRPLHVAVARLVGCQWPRQTGSSFPDCPALGPDGMEAVADDDGIVCLSPIRGEAGAADRLRALLAAAFGDEWSNAKERELLLETAVANDAKKPAADLGDWLRQSFFAEHCKLFQSRPFVWHIWDGNPHGFNALVNYHKLAAPNGQGRRTLELLTYTYLGDWMDRQKLDQAEGINGSDDRLAAALDLQGQLKKILDGEPPYDIFVRWKPLHQQAIGWDPDINDGVRLNIRPFLNAQLRKGGKAGAGILRAKPGTIKWAKDRGKEPMRSQGDFPWFWGWDENSPAMATDFGAPIPGAPPAGDRFDGNRWNDLHYTRAAKEGARARNGEVS